MYCVGICTMGSSSACIFKDGFLLAAVEEERLSRIKNDDSFPILSILECLKVAQISIEEVDYISVYWQPWRVMTRIRGTLLKMFSSFNSTKTIFIAILRILFSIRISKKKPNKNGSWIDLFFIKKLLIRKIGKFKGKVYYFDHHKTHQKYAESLTSWKNFISLSYDGGGEEHSTIISVTQNGSSKILKKIDWPNSLGHFYSYFTGFLGFKMLEGEYKMMGLAPLGKPVYKDLILKKILILKNNGNYRFNSNFCDYHSALNGIFNEKVEKFLSLKKTHSDNITQSHINLASSVQAVFEEVLSHMLKWSKNKFPNIENLVLSGGCALNVSANGTILKSNLFKNISLPPAPHDAGCAIGAALLLLDKKISKEKIVKKSLMSPYLGYHFSNDEILKVFEELELTRPIYYDEEELIKITCDALMQKKIVCWFQGRSEFGPRALGSRSFLADPRNDNIKEIINLKIKKRELFRPFAPSCNIEAVDNFFEIKQESPYMNIVTNVIKEKINLIPAVVHSDDTARIHTVNKENNPIYYKLIKHFGNLTNVPVLLNTSFNIQEPIVYSPKDAINTFLKSKTDLLVINNFICDENWRKTNLTKNKFI